MSEYLRKGYLLKCPQKARAFKVSSLLIIGLKSSRPRLQALFCYEQVTAEKSGQGNVVWFMLLRQIVCCDFSYKSHKREYQC